MKYCFRKWFCSLFRALLLLASSYTLLKLCASATGGFSLFNIYAPSYATSLFPVQESVQGDLELLRKATAQPFYYLNKGGQSYVFRSADGKYVIKFFKFHNIRIPPWIDGLPTLPSFLEKERSAKREKKALELKRTLQSYILAYKEMQAETGLLFLHLQPTTHLELQTTIVDKIGRHHLLNLDEVEFVFQVYATPTIQALEEWMARGEKEAALQGLFSLLELTLKRCHRGIFDRDPNFKTNFGFKEGQPLQIDCGSLFWEPSEKEAAVYGPELLRIAQSFERWLSIDYPSLLQPFQEEAKRLYAEAEKERPCT